MMVTLTGTFTRLDGTPATGTVRVTPSRSPILDSDGKIVISGPQTFPLDKDGKLTTEIPASNDPDLGPAFTYTVEALLSHNPWKISKVWIPHGSTTVDLSEIGDYTPTPGVATRVVTIPADGADGQVLVWDGAGFSWDFPPTGPQGPPGDVDAEQLAGAPRLTNLIHDMTWVTSNATIDSQTPRLAKFTVTARNGFIRWSDTMAPGAVYYFAAAVKATSDQVHFGTNNVLVYHSGSGGWERLTGLVTTSVDTWLMARDQSSSGWDQIEVRDPVLIDLTAVFGAGREPTKEYMDALMAKRGNYIGGVDQFAFGDALQALTVAGPGMTLWRSTTVGERVFLDYPGGTVMVHGDTGWRDVTPPLPDRNMTGGQILVRRVNSNLTVWLKDIMFDEMTGPGTLTAFTTVAGMAAANNLRTTFDIGDTNIATMDEIIVYASGNTFYVRWQSRKTPTARAGTASETTIPRSGIVHLTLQSETWPTTLPGIPY